MDPEYEDETSSLGDGRAPLTHGISQGSLISGESYPQQQSQFRKDESRDSLFSRDDLESDQPQRRSNAGTPDSITRGHSRDTNERYIPSPSSSRPSRQEYTASREKLSQSGSQPNFDPSGSGDQPDSVKSDLDSRSRDFESGSKKRMVKGLLDLTPAPLDPDEMNAPEPSEKGSEANSGSSIAERVKNAEPMLRQGSEYNLLGNRYGSMQSIPEHEPARSDVFGSDVMHVKTQRNPSSTRSVSTGLQSSPQQTEDATPSLCSFYEEVPSEALRTIASASRSKSDISEVSKPEGNGFKLTGSGAVVEIKRERSGLKGVLKKDSFATESVAETESTLFGRGGGRRAGGRGEPPVVQEEGGSASKTGARVTSVGSTNSSMFMNAVETGDVNVVRKALDNPNLDPDKKTKYQSRSALHLAAGYGQYGVCEELLYAGADPVALSQTGRTALHEACAGGHDKVLQLLLDYTRDFDLKDADGRTPSHMAAFHGEVKCLETLLDKGAAQVVSDKAGRQPAHLAAMRDHRPILEYLYDKGIDLQCKDSQGKLPVHYAAQYGALDLLICLVERECDITLEDNHGNLPIHFAAWNDHLDCVRFLIKQGTSMEATQADGRTTAHVAALHGSYKVLHWLCSKGASVDALDNYLNTPLHLAGEAGKPKCFNCLLQHDADLDAINRGHDTPFNSAKKSGHKLIIEKAISNEKPCPLCKQKFEYEEWEDLNGPAPVVRTVTQMGQKAFINPVPKYERTKTQIEINAAKRREKLLKKKQQKLKQKGESSLLNGGTTLTFLTQSESEVARKRLPRRDLAAKYFGEYLTNDMYKLRV